jgi:hypothetical protein
VLLLFVRTLRQPPHAAVLARGSDDDSVEARNAAHCVAWRATRCGSVLADRTPLVDLPCYARINPRTKHVSGTSTRMPAGGRLHDGVSVRVDALHFALRCTGRRRLL